jgi:ubiquinone/menaquinone biosynthesis C-methylase UbiE
MEQGHGTVARMAFEKLRLARDGWYLDVGCGNGYTVRWAASAAPEGRAIGIDISAEMVELARRRSAGMSNVEFRQAAFPEDSLPRDRFDAVFSMEVLYYLPDLHAALDEILRLLAPGGRFACVVDFYEENEASHSWPEDVGVEMTLLSEAGWADAFRRAGFAEIEQERLRLPPELASFPWKVTVGSLLTLGTKA